MLINFIINKSKKIFHIGRKVPKGFKELPGGIHMGGGIWLLPVEKIVGERSKNIERMRR